MVDCGSLRCAQERRSLRRDLQSLSKKLPVILGLESIAAQYVNSEDKQKESSNSVAGSGCESHPPACQDFQASSRCFYCEKKVPNIYKRIDRIIGDVRKGKENKGKICLRSLQDLMPFCLDFYTRGFGRELFSESVKNYFMMAAPEVQEEDHSEISNKNSAAASSQTGELVVPYHAENKWVKEIPRLGEEENREDAIDEDFQRDYSLSEHMAMLYTIPHALISSKILNKEEDNNSDHPFQLLERNAGYFPLPNPLHLPSSIFAPPSDYNDLVFLQNPHDALPSPFSHSLPGHQSADLLRNLHLAHIRRLHNLNGSNRNQPPPAHKSQLKLPLLVNVVRKLVHERFMEIKKLHRKRQEDNCEYSSENESMSPLKAFTPTAVPTTSLQEESLLGNTGERSKALSFQYSRHHDADSLLKHFGKVNECSRIGNALKGIIGKTISEKMKFRDFSSDENENPDYPKLYRMRSSQSYNPLTGASGPYKREADSTTQCDKDTSSPLKRSKKDISKNRCFSSKSPTEGSSKSSKKTRPKRGQYRKYNSQLLMDAVRAVQRGEMSVHRAGSFFGVPHSTLEYKVKERHLLRQRKGRDSGSLSSSASPPKSEAPLVTTINLSRDSSPALSEASLTSKKFNEPLNSKTSISSPPPLTFAKQDEVKNHATVEVRSNGPLTVSSSHVSCPTFSLSGRSQDLSATTWLPSYLSSSSQCDSTVGFPASGMSLNTSASELLRKLQHKVQFKDCHSPESVLHLPLTKDSAYESVASKENSGELAESLSVFH